MGVTRVTPPISDVTTSCIASSGPTLYLLYVAFQHNESHHQEVQSPKTRKTKATFTFSGLSWFCVGCWLLVAVVLVVFSISGIAIVLQVFLFLFQINAKIQ